MADFAPRSMKRKNVKGLALTPAVPKPPPTAETANNDESANLEIGIEYNLDLRPEDIEFIKELGSGNGGTVSKVRHIPTNTTIARKVIHVEAKREMRKRIVRELQIMRGCHSEYIVTFYGSFLNNNNDVIMCMEYMDVGSLDRVSRVFGPVRVDVLGKIAEATLGGLMYLYMKHHIMHRDIKPSNILLNSRGNIKLCDFGVSGELINSIADTFVGTSTYMAPERIQGERYTVKSDVWSFGLTIMELAIGKFPFAASEQLSDAESAPAGILDLLQQIVHEPAPRLPKSDAFPSILEDMIQKCLYKNPDERPTPQELFDQDPFVQAAKRTPVDLREWAVGMMERDNRKSHLVPQLSPATQELLRGNDTPSTLHSEDSTLQTPASSEVSGVSGNSLLLEQHGASLSSRSQIRPAPLGSGGGFDGAGTISGGSSSSGFGSLGRANRQAVHPGLDMRVPSSKSNSSGLSSVASGAGSNSVTFSLPVRLASEPNDSLPPPPPPKKESPEELRRRQFQQQQQQQQQAQQYNYYQYQPQQHQHQHQQNQHQQHQQQQHHQQRSTHQQQHVYLPSTSDAYTIGYPTK
ncbi:MAP kinase kinase (MEK) [Sporothrix epigloea]|uniref:MAP kinase kinase (MEK) n=1 Tax=Sporothrix epigloea TaxID=1892477 RepID=A0ABP0D8V9_9PEZI